MDFFKFLPVAFKALNHREDISRLYVLAQPALEAAKKAAPEFIPLFKRVLADIFPQLQQSIEGKVLTSAFTIEWLQKSLNELGDNIKVDGDYGEQTKEAVKRFQEKFMGPLDVDGWAGTETCVAIWNQLQSKK